MKWDGVYYIAYDPRKNRLMQVWSECYLPTKWVRLQAKRNGYTYLGEL